MDFLSLQASLNPNKIAVADLTSGQSWTYPQWNNLIGLTATWIKEQGLQAGDRLVCLSQNRAEIIALHLACARTGVLFVPLNWRLSIEEINTLLKDCQPKLVVGDTLAIDQGVDCFNISKLLVAVSTCKQLLETNEHFDDPSLILYTSGTTGVPKGVLHSEASIMETTLNMSLLAHVDENSAFLCEAPMFHVIGLISSLRPVFYHGGTVYLSDGFIPTRTLSRLADKNLGITHYFCVPQMACILRQQAEFKPEKLSNLKAILTGGAPHPAVQIRDWLADGIPIVDGYGMSEAGTIFGMPFDIETIDAKAGFVGVPGPRIEIRLTDSNNNETVDGAAGEVEIKGNNLFLGIWNKPELFADCFTSDGWFKTGDVAIKDEDGFYRIVDRIKDMYISGGENVYPVEVESVVLKDPQVLECALIGIPDEKWGEVGCLFVVAKPDIVNFSNDDLLTTLKVSLAKYKLPKHIQLVDNLPRTGAGKVKKNILKEQYINLLN